jgi:hypothetical protein
MEIDNQVPTIKRVGESSIQLTKTDEFKGQENLDLSLTCRINDLSVRAIFDIVKKLNPSSLRMVKHRVTPFLRRIPSQFRNDV